jgi:23S rRNA (guanosine2251-2'-O)-methyltransferase
VPRDQEILHRDHEILYGVHPVREALRAGRRRALRLHLRERERPEVRELAELARSADVPVVRADAAALEALAGPEARTQGVVLEAGPLPELEPAALAASAGPESLLVALDGVEDPQNVGAIVRVAEAAGADGLLLTRRHAPPLSAALARASAGAVEHLPVARAPNLPQALKSLKELDYWVFGGDSGEGEDLYGLSDRVVAGRKIVVLGAEGRGIRPAVLDQVDHRVRIPLAGRVESLNVSAAAAVLLFELRRRQGPPARR